MGRIYDLFVSKYNYTDFHELNLDWLIAAIKQMEYELENFVSINAVKYADPIQWDITRQYEKNTIVIDPITGTAYISSKPVPIGVALSNTSFWNVVFDLGRFITLAAQNFANSYEPVFTTTATVATSKDGWVVWNSVLYQALNDIHIGDAYVEDGNIKQRTVEYFFNQIKNALDSETENRINEDARIELSLTDLITSEINTVNGKIGSLSSLTTNAKDTIVNAVNEVDAHADTNMMHIGDLQLLTTNAKNTIVNAVNEVDAHADTNMMHIGDLQFLTTNAKNTIVNAVNEVDAHADTNMTHIGDLQLLTTSDKSTIVNAINEINDNNRDHIILFGDSWADYIHDPTNVMIPQVLENHFNCTVHNYAYGGTGFDVQNGYDEQITRFNADNIDVNTIKFVVLVCGLNDYQRTTTQEQFNTMIIDWYTKLTNIIGTNIPVYWFHNYSIANEVVGVTNPTTFYQQWSYYKYVAEHMNIPIIAPDTFAWVNSWRNDTHPDNNGSFFFANNMCRAIEGIESIRSMYSSVEFTVNGHTQTIEYYYKGEDLLDIFVRADIDDLKTISTVVSAPYTHSPCARIKAGEYIGAGFSIAANDYSAVTIVCNATAIAGAFTQYSDYNNLNAQVKMA